MGSAGDVETVSVHPFDVAELHAPSLVIFLGTPGSGKTSACRSILLELYRDAALHGRTNFPLLHTAMYGSKGDDEYAGLVHQVVTHNDLQPEGMKSAVNRLLRMRKNIPFKQGGGGDAASDASGGGGGPAHRGVAAAVAPAAAVPAAAVPPEQTTMDDLATRMIWDDITSQRQKFEAGGFVNFIYRKNRHVNASVFLCTQYLADTPLWMRQLSSHVFIRAISNKERKAAFDNFGHAFRNIKEFNKVLTEVTATPGRCLVINMRAAGGSDGSGAGGGGGGGGASARFRPPAGGGPAVVSYYDTLPHALMTEATRLVARHFTHPDVLAHLDARGDSSKYGIVELME